MRFVCNKCNTKYSIPDEKVAGKILKLRCKKCGNTIVLKDPKMASAKEHSSKKTSHSGKGKNLLQDAFKRSMEEEAFGHSEFGDSLSSDNSSFGNEEKTRIAQMPVFDDPVVEEEWYLADSRGQFGPMNLSELVARIKRGEPDSDAVVWKDGFDDWLSISDVPELKPYYKHIPPPRKPTKEMAKVQVASKVESQPHVYEPASKPEPASVAHSQGIAVTGKLAASEQPAPIIITAPQASSGKWFAIGGAMLAVSIVAFFLGGKLLKASSEPQTQPLKRQTSQNTAPPPVMKPQNTAQAHPKTTKVESIYEAPSGAIVDVDSINANTDTKRSKRTGRHKKYRLNRSSSSTSKNNGTDTPSSAPSAPSRSRSDFKAVMRTNREQISRCFALAVRKGQKQLVDHKITFMLRIKPSGRVASVDFDGALPPIMKHCLTRSITSWKFPRGSKTDKYNFVMHFN